MGVVTGFMHQILSSTHAVTQLIIQTRYLNITHISFCSSEGAPPVTMATPIITRNLCLPKKLHSVENFKTMFS